MYPEQLAREVAGGTEVTMIRVSDTVIEVRVNGRVRMAGTQPLASEYYRGMLAGLRCSLAEAVNRVRNSARP